MRLRCEACLSLQFLLFDRLQNSPYFCVFKYARAVKQKVWNEVENRARDWEETLSLASHASRACDDRALRARKTLTPRFTDFFTDFEKKTDCFAVYIVPLFSSDNVIKCAFLWVILAARHLSIIFR